MVKKILTELQREEKAIEAILRFAKDHRVTLKTVLKLKDELIGLQDIKEKLEAYTDYIRLCEAMLRREDEYLKQIAKGLRIRLDDRRQA